MAMRFNIREYLRGQEEERVARVDSDRERECLAATGKYAARAGFVKDSVMARQVAGRERE